MQLAEPKPGCRLVADLGDLPVPRVTSQRANSRNCPRLTHFGTHFCRVHRKIIWKHQYVDTWVWISPVPPASRSKNCRDCGPEIHQGVASRSRLHCHWSRADQQMHLCRKTTKHIKRPWRQNWFAQMSSSQFFLWPCSNPSRVKLHSAWVRSHDSDTPFWLDTCSVWALIRTATPLPPVSVCVTVLLQLALT